MLFLLYNYYGGTMIDNYMLYKNLPSIDLHGSDRYSASILVKEFINDNYKLGNKLILIIHGKGLYILKNTVHEILKKDKKVKEYKVDMFNPGTTIVELK